MIKVSCHQAMVHVGPPSDLGLQMVYLRSRHIGTIKDVHGRYAIMLKQGKPRNGTYALWLACGIILSFHIFVPAKDQQELL